VLSFLEYLTEDARMAIASANLKSIAYDEEWETLDVYFRSGGVYRYEDVPPDVVEELKFAESRGRYFWIYIRNSYPYTMLRAPRKGFKNAYNTEPSSTHQRHRMRVKADAPFQG